LQPARFDNASDFYAPKITLYITFPDWVEPGWVEPGWVDWPYFNAPQFFSPTIQTTVTISANRFDNAQTFFPATITKSLYEITAAQATLLYQIYLLHGLDGPLVVGATQRAAPGLLQDIGEAGGTVTISTSTAPTTPLRDPGLMIQELAALHGLTTTLSVTPTTRVAGTISQIFSTAGTTTTVTRQ
jgi:hypothetical protein